MEKITELVVALILTLNGNVIEHVYKDKMSDCLKSKGLQKEKLILKELFLVVEKSMQKLKSIWAKKKY